MTSPLITYIDQAKNAYKSRLAEDMYKALAEAKNILQEAGQSSTIIEAEVQAAYIRLWMLYHDWQKTGETHGLLKQHLTELEVLEQAEAEDYLRLTCLTDCTLEDFEKILLLHPENQQLILDLGKYYLSQKHYEKAIICFQQVRRHWIGNHLALTYLYLCQHQWLNSTFGTDLAGIDEENLEKVLTIAHDMTDGKLCLELLEKFSGTSKVSESSKLAYKAIGLSWLDQWKEASEVWNALPEEIELPIEGVLAYAEYCNLSGQYSKTITLLTSWTDKYQQQSPEACTLEELLVLWQSDDSITMYQQLQVYVLLGKALLQTGKPEDAIQISDKALELKADDPVALQEAAKIHFAAGDFEKAIDLMKRARRHGLQEKFFLSAMADFYFQSKNWGSTKAVLEEYHKRELPTPQTLYLGGVANYHLGNFQDAYNLLSQCISSNTSYRAGALYYRILLLRAHHKFNEAVADITQLLPYYSKESADYWHIMLLMGDMAYQLGDYDHAYAYLVNVHLRVPLKNPHRLYLQMLIHKGHGRGQKVPADIEKLSESTLIEPAKDATDFVHNANVYQQVGRLIDASEAFEKAAENGYLPEMHYEKAFYAAFKAEAYDRSITLYEKIITCNPGRFDKNLYANYAFALFKTGDYHRTIEAYKIMLYTYPAISGDDDTIMKWGRVITEAYYLVGNYDEAIRHAGIMLSKMTAPDGWYMKLLQKIAEEREDGDDYSRYGLLQSIAFSNQKLDEKEEFNMKTLKVKLIHKIDDV